MTKKLLEVENLHVTFSLKNKPLSAVRGISFTLHEGESLGLVGESGSGKTSAVQALVGLTSATVTGRIQFHGGQTLGRHIGMIFQDPMTSLNPTMRIGAQITEGLLYHKLARPPEAHTRALELLHICGLSDPSLRLRQYPHELSGGQRQRVLIAIALACSPHLLIADEPTTALDTAIQTQILTLLRTLQQKFRMSLLLISHDLSAVAHSCDRLLIFYAGKIVEQGPTHTLLTTPRHPYTQMLLACRPRPGQTGPLQVIDGAPPPLNHVPPGCPFVPRCPHAHLSCLHPPPFIGTAACWRKDP